MKKRRKENEKKASCVDKKMDNFIFLNSKANFFYFWFWIELSIMTRISISKWVIIFFSFFFTHRHTQTHTCTHTPQFKCTFSDFNFSLTKQQTNVHLFKVASDSTRSLDLSRVSWYFQKKSGRQTDKHFTKRYFKWLYSTKFFLCHSEKAFETILWRMDQQTDQPRSGL